jgi:hypothetical protein
VDRKSHDRIHHGLTRHIDWDGLGHASKEAGEAVDPTFGQEQGLDCERGPGQQHPQDHFPLGNEAVLSSHQIALAHMAVGLDAGIVGRTDGDQHGLRDQN